MIYDVLTGKEVNIPDNIEIKVSNTFIINNLEYIITSISRGLYGHLKEVRVMPKDEYIKICTVQRCEDGIIRTLKEIEESTAKTIYIELNKKCPKCGSKLEFQDDSVNMLNMWWCDICEEYFNDDEIIKEG